MAKSDRSMDPSLQAMMERRAWLAASIAATSCCLNLFTSAAADEPVSANKSEAAENDDRWKLVRVKSVLEVQGSVLIRSTKEPANNGIQKSPIESRTTLEYEEAILSDSEIDDRFAVQLYSQADCENTINKHPSSTTLRDICLTIVKRSNAEATITTCLDNPLTSPEQDLVEGPITTMHLENLLPKKPIKLGDRWEVNGPQLARLLNLDKIESGSLSVTLIEADAKLGQLEMRGKIQGVKRDVKTTIDIEGKANVDRKAAIISWAALKFEEKREVGDSEPGFEVTARLRVLRERVEQLSQEIDLNGIKQKADSHPSLELARFHSKLGAYQFIADRNWVLYTDAGVDATLRWTQKNRTFAQCNVTNLTDTEPGKQLSIEGYQGDIQKSLGKQLGQIVEATERLSNSGLRMMRVVSIGTTTGGPRGTEQLPMHYVHILLSNDDGRHLSLAFSMNAASADRFGTQDLQIADTMEFTLRQLPTLPKDSKEKEANNPEDLQSAKREMSLLRK